MALPSWVTAVLRRDVLLLRDAPWSLVLSLASTTLGVLVFGLLGRFVGQGTDYVAFVLVGIAFLRVIDAVVHAPGQGLREERSRGSLEVLLDAPRPPWALVMLSGIVPAARALIEGMVALSLAAILFHPALHPGRRGLLLIPVALLAALLLALATGLFLGAASLQSRAATAASSFFALAVAMTAGVYYPRRALPAWLRDASALSPYTPALRAVRSALTHRGSPWADLGWTLLAAGLLLGTGGLIMARGVRLARQSGSLARG